VRFGVHLASNGPLATPERLATLATRAETLGFESIWVSDHILFPVGFATPYPYGRAGSFNAEWNQHYEPLATLAWLAGQNQRVELGTSVLILPMRNPVAMAKQAATIDRLSGGRLILGAGVGWLREELEALQAPPFERRGDVADEWIGLMRRLWTEEQVEHRGQFYQHGPIMVQPTPARLGGPPIVIGGVGSRAWAAP
jgi:probable F420-dependent oxidoreductase